MNWARPLHEGLSFIYSARLKEFEGNLDHLEDIQRLRLSHITKKLQKTEFWKNSLSSSTTYEDLASQLPVREYEDFRPLIEQQRNSSRPLLTPTVTRFEPTSGSTSQRKWIPYSPGFLQEINHAAAVWMGDTYRQYPHIKQGPHYWSLSWLPQELRSLTSSDDSDLFPWWQRFFLQKLMATPPTVSLASTPEAAWYATLCFLYSQKDLTLFSVWSPSFLLKILQDLEKHHEKIESNLTRGSWGEFEAELRSLFAPPPPRQKKISPQVSLAQALWPRLQLISSWDSALSQTWMMELKKAFPQTSFQGKGLWATEGVVSFPFRGRKILASHSHFYEFRCLSTGKILPAWQLEKDQEVQPLLWTSSGLLRYALADRLRVEEFIGHTPCFEFLGRLQGTDMVGEKIDASAAAQILKNLSTSLQTSPLGLLAVRKPNPHYVVALKQETRWAAEFLEKELQKFHHYQVARELGQLQPAQVSICSAEFFFKQVHRSQILGQNKLEALYQVDEWKA